MPQVKKVQKEAKPHIIPSVYKIEKLKEKRLELAIELTKQYGFNKADAFEIVDNEKLFNDLLVLEDKHIRLKLLKEIIPEIFTITKKKLETGWTQNAKDAITALGISLDKALEKDTKKSTLNIGGNNVQVNVDWKPKWLSKGNK